MNGDILNLYIIEAYQPTVSLFTVSLKHIKWIWLCLLDIVFLEPGKLDVDLKFISGDI